MGREIGRAARRGAARRGMAAMRLLLDYPPPRRRTMYSIRMLMSPSCQNEP